MGDRRTVHSRDRHFPTLPISPTPHLPSSPSPPPSPSPQLSPDTLFQQGITQFRAQQYTAAIQSWQAALAGYQQAGQAPGELQTLENLGFAYQTLGQAQLAIAAYQQQLAVARQLDNRMAQAQALANLGSNYRTLGNYPQSLNYTQQSLTIWQALGDRAGEGKVLANLGNIQAELGKYETAIALHRRSLAIAQQLNNATATVISLNSIGALHGSLGQYTQARQAYEQGVALARTINFPLAEGTTLNNLGAILHTQGDYAQAVKYYEASLAIAQRLNDLRMLGTALSGLGLGYTSLQQYEQALKYQQQSLAVLKQLGDRKLEGFTLSNLGYTYWRSGDLPQAAQHYRAAMEILESLRSQLTDTDLVSIIDTQQVSYNSLQHVLVSLKQPEAALEIAERSRARAFVELLSRRYGKRDQTAVQSTAPAPTIADIRRIAQAQNATLVQYAISPDPEFIAQGKLKGSDAQLFIWVVQPSGTVTFRPVDLRGLKALDLTVETLVQRSRGCLAPGLSCEELAIATPEATTPTRRTNPALRRLHHLLIEPIADLLPTPPAARVIFIPQGSLFLVPFPALQAADGSYLIERHTPLTAPSIQVLALTRQLKAQRPTPSRLGSAPARLTPALIVGNPVMPTVGGEPLSPLPASEAEAQQIASLFKTQALIGAAATERAVLQAIAQARLIHLATHGLLEYGEATGETGIPGAIALAPNDTPRTSQNTNAAPTVLAARNQPTGDRPGPLRPTAPKISGILSADEIFDLRLQADLVVLSACDTGRGRITGDGVIGLSRSFISAGAPSVIVSLWAVSDASTARLMVQFYESLLQQPDKAKALRQAMLATMQVYPRPLDWAAFTLIGEAD